jgi:hypothetical protein
MVSIVVPWSAKTTLYQGLYTASETMRPRVEALTAAGPGSN